MCRVLKRFVMLMTCFALSYPALADGQSAAEQRARRDKAMQELDQGLKKKPVSQSRSEKVIERVVEKEVIKEVPARREQLPRTAVEIEIPEPVTIPQD